MPVKRLKDYLDKAGVKYLTISHSRAYTAQEVAASAHIPGIELAKSVIVKIDGTYAMAVLPASEKVDMESLRQAMDADRVELATEAEFMDLFPDCDLGAMPPFGNLFSMKVYVAPDLVGDDQIAFNAGTHTELIKMSYEDFNRLVEPIMLEFAVHV